MSSLKRTQVINTIVILFLVFGYIGYFFLNTSDLFGPREAGPDSRIKATLSSMTAAAEVYAAQSDNGYSNFCTSDVVKSLSRSIAELESSLTCFDSKEDWAAEALLTSQLGYFCVDYTGFSSRIEASSISETDFSCGGSTQKSGRIQSIENLLPHSILKYGVKNVVSCTTTDIESCFGSGKIPRADLQDDTFFVYDLISTDKERRFGVVDKRTGITFVVTVNPT